MNVGIRSTKKIEVVVEIDMIPHRSFINSNNHYYSIVYWYRDINKYALLLSKLSYVYSYRKWVTFIIIEGKLPLLL